MFALRVKWYDTPVIFRKFDDQFFLLSAHISISTLWATVWLGGLLMTRLKTLLYRQINAAEYMKVYGIMGE